MAELKNITGEKLEKIVGVGASDIWKRICVIGGFGDVEFSNPGGLDISGLPDAKQAQIQKLLEEPEAEKSESKDKSKGGK